MANLRLEYEKQMQNLNKVMNCNCEGDENIKELVEWYRKECAKRPIMGGDHVVIAAIKNAAYTGLTLSMSIHEAYARLRFNLGYAKYYCNRTTIL